MPNLPLGLGTPRDLGESTAARKHRAEGSRVAVRYIVAEKPRHSPYLVQILPRAPVELPSSAPCAALAARIKNPPCYVDMHDLKSLQGYEEGRKAWLKWRYDNYGLIPGREELFTQFAKSGDQEAPVITTEEVELIEEVTTPEPAIEESAEVVATEPIKEDVEQSSNWWLWLVGLLVVVGGIALAIRRKS